jgi:tRNA 2-thiouridine synthesizing protein B
MSILHTVNKSPFERTAFASCLAHASPGDAVLLIEDGVYGAVKGGTAGAALAKANGAALYALGPDLAARGLKEEALVEGVRIVDYDGFVDLVAEHDVSQAWL